MALQSRQLITSEVHFHTDYEEMGLGYYVDKHPKTVVRYDGIENEVNGWMELYEKVAELGKEVIVSIY